MDACAFNGLMSSECCVSISWVTVYKYNVKGVKFSCAAHLFVYSCVNYVIIAMCTISSVNCRLQLCSRVVQCRGLYSGQNSDVLIPTVPHLIMLSRFSENSSNLRVSAICLGYFRTCALITLYCQKMLISLTLHHANNQVLQVKNPSFLSRASLAQQDYI